MDMRMRDEQEATDWKNQVMAALMVRNAMYAVRLPDGSIATALGFVRDDGIVPLALAIPRDMWEQIPHLAGDDDVQPFQS